MDETIHGDVEDVPVCTVHNLDEASRVKPQHRLDPSGAHVPVRAAELGEEFFMLAVVKGGSFHNLAPGRRDCLMMPHQRRGAIPPFTSFGCTVFAGFLAGRFHQPIYFSAYNQKTIIVVTERRGDGAIWQLCALGQDDLEILKPFAKDNKAFQQIMTMPQKPFGNEPVVSPVPPHVPTATDGQHRH